MKTAAEHEQIEQHEQHTTTDRNSPGSRNVHISYSTEKAGQSGRIAKKSRGEIVVEVTLGQLVVVITWTG